MPAGNDPGTLSAWVNLDSVLEIHGAIMQYGSAGDTLLLGIMVGTLATLYMVGWLADVKSDGTMPTGEWNHLTITYDGEFARMYINGELDTTREPGLKWGNQPKKLNTIVGTTGGTIGCPFNKNEAEESFSFGFIDEVSVYDRTLSADEVKQNYDTDTQATAVESAGKVALTWGGIKLSR